MAYTKDSLQRLFQSKFNLPKWQMVLQDYFHADKVRKSPEALDEDAEERKGYFLGETMTKDGYKMGFFYYGMEDGSVLRRKVGLRNLIRPYLGYGFDAALAVFDDGKNWRLSLICDLKGDAEATNAKRFTYVFGDEKAYYKTPVARFLDLQKKADEYLEIKNAFSVEALSDDFFDEYRKQYAEFVKFLTGKVYVKKGNKMVEQEVDEPDAQFFTSFGEDEKLVRDYIKKMMGRIVFLYFLQSKGWLANNLHYMHDLFDNASDDIKADFLDKVLEPMFFGLLNTKPEDRATAPIVNGVGVKYIPDAETIPYLNGGLFQQEQIDEVDSRFPAKMFQSLFDFFDSYNFTIDENDPNDAEVGVDPEMLGKIFENLLEDNKDKGAFYTPKEIVRYMCQESLIAYLQTGIEDEETKKSIANFVKTNDVEELGGASSELAMSIDQKLKDVKICDPAIGSGAFPMGLLRELYACRKAIEVFESDNAADIKRHIIQNNIYGVDIEKGAVDIARLRFWLALIIDEKEPMPLPNLDFKIMQGNSLLESFMGVDLNMTSKKVKTGRDTKKTRGVLSLGFEETDVQKTIQDLVKSYFSITDHILRAQRRKEIDKYVKDYIKICAEGNKEVQNAVDELEIPNSQFFLWHTYFNDVFEKGGFDIVIGNPPYVQVQTNDRILYCDYPALEGHIDLYELFILQGIFLMKSGGVLSYIIPNTILSNLYSKQLRKLLIKEFGLCEITNFGMNVFLDQVVHTCILRMQKHKDVSEIGVKRCVKSYTDVDNDFDYYLFVDDIEATENYTFDISLNEEERFLFNKLNQNAKLGELCFIRQCIKTGNDKEFVVSSSTSMPYPWKKTLKGKGMERYLIREGNLYLKYGNWLARNWANTDFYERPKIAIREAGKQITACLDDENRYFLSSLYACYPKKEYNLLYLKSLLAILNSSLATYYVRKIAFDLSQGAFTKMRTNQLARLPIPQCVMKKELSGLVDKIMWKKKENPQADTTSLESQIDFLVYHLYGLTYDEVLIVDPNPPFTREEYEAYNIEQLKKNEI